MKFYPQDTPQSDTTHTFKLPTYLKTKNLRVIPSFGRSVPINTKGSSWKLSVQLGVFFFFLFRGDFFPLKNIEKIRKKYKK